MALPLLVAALVVLLASQAGKRIPVIRRSGMDVVAVLLFPAWLASTGYLDPAALGVLEQGFGKLDILGWFVAVIIVGSLAAVDLRWFGRMAMSLPAPVLAGSFAALGAGTLAAMLAGAAAGDALFLGAVPVMAGGIALGAIPLANGYAQIRGTDPGDMLGLLLPAVVVGNLLAMLVAAAIRQRDEPRQAIAQSEPLSLDVAPARWQTHLLALALLVALQLLAQFAQARAAIPASLSLIVLVVVLRLTRVLPGPLRLSLVAIHRQCLRWLLFSILALVGMLVLPWQSVLAGFAAPTFAAATAVVVCLALAGAMFARWMRMSARGGGTLFLSRAAMGGTGNVVILGTANRMELMPLAMLLTRIGGLATVAGALALMRAL